MKFKKSQSGRSMVEMLGVLAIIGVLSVGGIAGYSLSMRRHRANQVADVVSKFALASYNQCHQKVLNGELTDITKCNRTNLSTFLNADIGDFPVGVRTIHAPYVNSDPNIGVDILWASVVFDDDKLCQAFASVMGSTCTIGETTYAEYTIKQN